MAVVRFPSNSPTSYNPSYYFRGLGGPVSSYDVFSFYTPYCLGKQFQVIQEFVITMTPASSTANVTREFTLMMNTPVSWTSSTFLEGELRLVLLSDSGLSPHPIFVMNMCVWYTDL